MKTLSEQEAFLKLSALCSSAEHCSYEMLEKMRRWNIAEEAQARIMQRLIADKYIDDERFCRAFVRDKIRYNKWGRRKIEQALFLKRIPEDISKRVLNEVDDEEYLEVLRPLIESKRRTTKAANDFEMKAKLMRFALSRGFLMEQVYQVWGD